MIGLAPILPDPLPGWQVALVVGLWLVPVLFWFMRSVAGELFAKFMAQTAGRKALLALVFAVSAIIGADKGPVTASAIFKFLFWDPGQPWQLANVKAALDGAQASVDAAESDLDFVEAETETNDVVTLSFDWHAPDRLPYHERQNVLAWTAAVVPTNIGGTLYEDHYVSFNAAASTNPAVILIEYAKRRDDGTVERYSSEVVTNSCPDTAVVELQSGSHTCYWFRCPVPAAFTNEVRDWNGEALFGSPEGSGRGFDLLGTLVVDDGNEVWMGATTNLFIGGATNEFINGINVTEGEE